VKDPVFKPIASGSTFSNFHAIAVFLRWMDGWMDGWMREFGGGSVTHI